MTSQLPAFAAVAATVMLAAACDSNGGGTGTPSLSSPPTSASKQAVAPAALVDLLLTPADVDSVLGVTGSRTDKVSDSLQEDPTAGMGPKGFRFPEECLYITGPALAPVYANSGSTSVHGERITEPTGGSGESSPDANQYVVMFPAAQQASAFFSTSAQRWPACANRQGTVPDGANSPGFQWTVGPVSNQNGVLSTTVSVNLIKDGEHIVKTCQRALTVRNNVAIDVDGCRQNPGNVGVDIANLIAGKVDKQ
ncbi:pknM [Mycobacterium lentiflavum]|uniref:PknM n=1 Tax=Mycobacterium lentiflavum TaxID=141349 RepID=A0A0E4H242_MYCLN|nr:sensor domain-containing protein [Mycobacterium lentiflavum]MEE3063962.1 sensor domain-containing protein [Actinomycetota bacterium]ULP40752.1 sensor domain-containing protein [Mycobacterium lentiflavum]CQD16747.1 pknM [Mycobacterium lentiflavum]